jgi:hypothetical protein
MVTNSFQLHAFFGLPSVLHSIEIRLTQRRPIPAWPKCHRFDLIDSNIDSKLV